MDSLCLLVPRKRRRLALVVGLDAVGDFIIWMQYGAAEISRFARGSDRKVMLLANRAWAAYAQTTGLWDGVLEVEPASFVNHPWYRLRVLLRIRRLGAELLIQPRAARFFLLEDCIARTCGAHARIGNAGTLLNLKPWQRRVGNGFYSRVIEVNDDNSVHALHRHSQFASALTGQATVRAKLPRPRSSSPTGAVVVALGAGDAGRVWPIEKLAAVIRHVVNNHPGHPVRLYGLAADIETSRRLETLVGARLENMVGRTPLQEFVAAIADAKLTICNESSAYHIAMAYDTPVLCFLGGGHYGQFAPYPRTGRGPSRAAVLSVAMECYGCNWNCRYERGRSEAYPCVGSISADSALAAVDGLLAADRRPIRGARQANDGV
ncbi:MAG: glycosyltransferase family 9 protein [Gammaproteobacteria bacterium]|nr:glycosyltransferase family 9 protein [Gammaproteobacteria bacterium]